MTDQLAHHFCCNINTLHSLIVQSDPLSIDLNELQELFVSVGWKKREMEAIRQVLRASTHVMVATNDDRLVGFGRALSDGMFNATIYDVIVHSDYQGIGVGKDGLGRRVKPFWWSGVNKLKRRACPC